MLNITKTKEDAKLDIALEGRLDTTTAPQLEETITAEIEGVKELVFDFAALEYVSSAGLRVLLSAQKKMNKQGSMVIRNVSEEIDEIFNVTGFSDILTIE
ncbi:STAS domain-containing protein [Oribacterium sp. P6A1]|uniref:STAS domain-containing protein n=1 Tax=Oribacterium sp. P6A1 TaxID=1410612 RepID=UPI00056A3850|nr:STAS domain-containing protein [Oribacterium sp. P6A1]